MKRFLLEANVAHCRRMIEKEKIRVISGTCARQNVVPLDKWSGGKDVITLNYPMGITDVPKTLIDSQGYIKMDFIKEIRGQYSRSSHF